MHLPRKRGAKKSALALRAMLRSQAMQGIKSAPTWQVLRGNFADRKLT
jgi:hypothetical protein